MCLVQSMTCKDAINSDITSEDKKWYLVNENTRYNKIFEENLEGTTDQSGKTWSRISF